MRNDTQCSQLISAMKRGWMSPARAAHRFNIYSGYHRRLTEIRERGFTLSERWIDVKDSQGKVTKRWKEHRIAK